MDSRKSISLPFSASRVADDFLSAEQFVSLCDRVWCMDKRASSRLLPERRLDHRATVYCKRDRVQTLWPALARRRNRIVLVTSESDFSITEDQLLPAQVACWFGANSESGLVCPLPLGLGNSYCKVTAKAPQLVAAFGERKESLLYVNFRPETNPEVRGPLWRWFTSESWRKNAICDAGNVDLTTYVRRLSQHRFVLCPRGGGIDTHRMWEALYLGTIPVVEKHPALDSFRDLPILFVDNFSDLDSNYLEKTHAAFLRKSWNFEKLFLPYWKNRFEQARIGISHPVGWKDFLRCLLRRDSRAYLALGKDTCANPDSLRGSPHAAGVSC